jgi:AbrB family looped-hinge helix DNA binding protein
MEHTVEKVRVGPQGRVVIPAHIRRELSISAGDEFVVRVEEGRIVLESRGGLLKRLKDRYARVPEGVSLADELVDERRRAARREAEES